MAKRRKAAKARTPRRNPMARALGSGLFRPKVEARPDRPRRKPKHPRRPDEDENGG